MPNTLKGQFKEFFLTIWLLGSLLFIIQIFFVGLLKYMPDGESPFAEGATMSGVIVATSLAFIGMLGYTVLPAAVLAAILVWRHRSQSANSASSVP